MYFRLKFQSWHLALLAQTLAQSILHVDLLNHVFLAALDMKKKSASSSYLHNSLNVATPTGKFRNSTDVVPLRTPTIPSTPSGIASRSTSGFGNRPSAYQAKSRPGARTTMVICVSFCATNCSPSLCPCLRVLLK